MARDTPATLVDSPATLVDAVDLARVRDRDRVVVRIAGQDVTPATWQADAARVAAGLAGAGVGPGSRVGTLLSNRREALDVWLAVATIGAVEVPINTAMVGDLLADQVTRAGCELLLVDAAFVDAVTAVADALRGVRVVVVGDEVDEAFVARGQPPAPHEVSADDESLVLYTSGTTGPSKGVRLSHHTTMRLSRTAVSHVGLGPDDVLYTAFPLFHVAARFMTVVPALLTGGRAVVDDRFSASRFWDVCRAAGVTAVHYLGTLPMMLWNQPAGAGDRYHDVRTVYGAGMPAEIWEPFLARFGIDRIRELYGSTEQGIVAITTDDSSTPGTCGPPLDDVRIEIRDPHGEAVPVGEVGEIVTRPRDRRDYFTGYDGMEEATAETWRGGWFHTGDAGRLDDGGALVFAGRVKDAIRRRGENVSAHEVETVVDAHPAVVESAAVGVPSELGEEEVLVVAVLAAPLDPGALVDHCAAQLPSFAVPRFVRFVDEMPKNSSQRVLKRELAHVDDGTWDRDR